MSRDEVLRRLDALRAYHADRAESIRSFCEWHHIPRDAETWKLVETHRALCRAIVEATMAFSRGAAEPYDSAEAKRQLAAATAEILIEQQSGEKARAA